MSADVGAGVALAAGACLAVTVFVLGVRQRERTGGLGRVPAPEPGVARPADEAYEFVLRGGAWVNGFNVTWPMATLRVSRSHAELDVAGVEKIMVARGEVAGVRFIRRPLGLGIKFRTESGRLDKVTFWSLRPAAKQLRDLGWH